MDPHSKHVPLGHSAAGFAYPNYSSSYTINLPNLNPLKKTQPMLCPHTQKVYVCLEAPTHDKISQFIRSHILKCPHCFAKKQKIADVFISIKKNIPLAPMNEHFQEEINEEIKQWVNARKNQNTKSVKYYVKQFFKNIPTQKILQSEWTKYMSVSLFCFVLFKVFSH